MMTNKDGLVIILTGDGETLSLGLVLNDWKSINEARKAVSDFCDTVEDEFIRYWERSCGNDGGIS